MKPLIKKENLDKLHTLLPFILNAEGNEWFKSEVKKIILESQTNTDTPKDILHSYSELGDNYIIINPNAWLIDYDDIPDENVQIRLKADCFEMARHRLGRANHKHSPDFLEFCRYAHLQIEELVNYYFQKKYEDNLKEIKKDILKFNSMASGKIENADELCKIGILYKIWALNNKFGLGRESINIMSQLCYLRNDLSHRSSLSQKEDEQIIEEFERKNGSIRDIILSEQIITDKKIKTIFFRYQERWDDIIWVIIKLESKVMAEI